MGWTKRQFIVQAFEEIGLASYVFDLTPEQLQAALRRLDSMMSSWNAQGIRLSYPIPSSPQDSDIDQETDVPDSAWEAVYTNLGVRLAPGYGKTVSVDTKAVARNTYNILLQRASAPLEQQLPGTMPAGSGNKPWRWDDPYVAPPADPVLTGPEGPLQPIPYMRTY